MMFDEAQQMLEAAGYHINSYVSGQTEIEYYWVGLDTLHWILGNNKTAVGIVYAAAKTGVFDPPKDTVRVEVYRRDGNTERFVMAMDPPEFLPDALNAAYDLLGTSDVSLRFKAITQSDLDEERVGVAEVAEILGWARAKVSTYLSRGVLPEPVQRLANGPLWRKSQILAYRDSQRDPVHEVGYPFGLIDRQRDGTIIFETSQVGRYKVGDFCKVGPSFRDHVAIHDPYTVRLTKEVMEFERNGQRLQRFECEILERPEGAEW